MPSTHLPHADARDPLAHTLAGSATEPDHPGPVANSNREGQALPLMRVAPPGPESRRQSASLQQSECPAFEARREARAGQSGVEQGPIVYASGRGSNVFDVDGNRYVDLTAGFGALLLGHPPNSAMRAATAAMQDLPLALGDVYASAWKVQLSERLVAAFPEPGAHVMFGLSGADAVTAALKTAMLATRKPGIIAFEGAYHGLSHGPLAACGLAPNFRVPFADHLHAQVTFAPYPSREALHLQDKATSVDAAPSAADVSGLDRSLECVRSTLKNKDVGCILVEPVLGRGGCVVPPHAFLPELRALAGEFGALLIADEVWTGMGRTGALFASSLRGVVPDLVCLGKGLGGGIPISACVGRADAMAAWGAHGGTVIHTGTHVGWPPACAAALEVLAAVTTGGLAARAREIGAAWMRELEQASQSVAGAWRVRGEGMMVGIQLRDASVALAVARHLLARGFVVLTGGARGNTLTLSPPLTIEPELLSAFVEALRDAVRALT